MMFKDVVGYEGLYMVSDTGEIYSCINNKYLKPQLSKQGYLTVWLYKDNTKPKNIKIHRIVASAFLLNPNNLPQVNHKDEDKTNNHVDNLEWCNPKYNLEYGTRMNRIFKPVQQIDRITSSIIHVFDSILEASKETLIDATSICKACKGQRLSAGGYKWKYV